MASDALFELRFILEAPVPVCQDVKNALNAFSTQLAQGGPLPRGEVLEQGGYELVCKAWSVFCSTGESNIRLLTKEAGIIREATLRALWTLTPGYPEIIDETGFIMISQAFDVKLSDATHIEALKLMRNICIKSEANREALVSDWQIVEPFVNVIKKDDPPAELVREWCGALRTFVLNDDRRVVYNRAPERKRMVFQKDGHSYLANFVNAYNDVPTLNAIVNALGIMASNEDMCVGIEAAGGFRGLNTILHNHATNVLLIKNTISAIRYLNISAIVRDKCGGYNLMKPVLQAAWRNRGDAGFLEIAMSCLAFMTLRCPCGVAQLLVEKGVFFIIEMMKKHMTNVYVLKGACLTLRNVAANGGQIGRATILDTEGEALLRSIAETRKNCIQQTCCICLHSCVFMFSFLYIRNFTKVPMDESPNAMFFIAEGCSEILRCFSFLAILWLKKKTILEALSKFNHQLNPWLEKVFYGVYFWISLTCCQDLAFCQVLPAYSILKPNFYVLPKRVRKAFLQHRLLIAVKYLEIRSLNIVFGIYLLQAFIAVRAIASVVMYDFLARSGTNESSIYYSIISNARYIILLESHDQQEALSETTVQDVLLVGIYSVLLFSKEVLTQSADSLFWIMSMTAFLACRQLNSVNNDNKGSKIEVTKCFDGTKSLLHSINEITATYVMAKFLSLVPIFSGNGFYIFMAEDIWSTRILFISYVFTSFVPFLLAAEAHYLTFGILCYGNTTEQLRPIRGHRFFTVTYGLLGSICVVVVTYAILVLQFSMSTC